MSPKKHDPNSIAARARPNPRPCLWCAKKFKARRVADDYCSPVCARAYNNWRRARGAAIFDEMLAFRTWENGGRKPGGFSKVCAQADAALREQRERWAAFKKERGET